MKKVIIILFLFTLIFIKKQSTEYIIPNDALRFRVIANSNTIEDQKTKIEIKNNIEKLLTSDILTSNNKAEITQKITAKIPEIEKNIENYQIPYHISLGKNYFPEKTYKDVKYPEGMYDSLVVTLGAGAGENWWCVLYPPLCLMDEAATNQSNIEYKSLVKELFQKYL